MTNRTGVWSAALTTVLTVCVSAAPATADDASIRGAITDPHGARVAGAAVKLLRDGQVSQESTSDSDGAFRFEHVAAGRYQIQANADGFQARITAPAFLSDGAQSVVDISLPLGPLEADVTVTAAATEVLPSQVGAPVTVIDAQTLESIGKLDVLESLRLVPGSSLVQTGGRGGVASMFIRGGNSNFNKLLIDGIPANDIGGALDLSSFATTGVDRVETLREANSVIAGTDALAGVISITTRRGHSRVPEASVSADAGNLSTDHESAAVGGAVDRVDYFSEFSHFATDNDIPNNAYRNKTYAGRFGGAIGRNTDISATLRWIDRSYQAPNGQKLYGVPDDHFSEDRYRFLGVASRTLIGSRWHASARVGLSDQRQHYENPTISGEIIDGVGFGDTVSITGANGYSATGRAALDFGTYTGDSRAARQGLYAQTTYQVLRNVSVSGGGDYEREQAFTNPDADPTTTRHIGVVWTEGRGSFGDRMTATGGLGYAHIEGFASRFSPRLSVAVSLRKPRANEFWTDTRVTFNAGNGIKSASVAAVASSLYSLLQKTPAGIALATSAGVGPIRPERSRNVDAGIEQGLWRGRVRARAAYFNNRFYDLVEFVTRPQLPQFGVSSDAALAAGSGAYVNSQSFKSQGLEVSADARAGRLRAAASYTYLDAEVIRSLSSNVAPQFNPHFPTIPIGGYTALVGQRPFRRPANIGSLLVSYLHGAADVALTGYFAGRSDDSTFLVGSDLNFGNTLLLPNHDLNFGYAKVDVSGSYRFYRQLKWFATIENLFNEDYEPTFGFPALPINIRTGLTVTFGGR